MTEEYSLEILVSSTAITRPVKIIEITVPSPIPKIPPVKTKPIISEMIIEIPSKKFLPKPNPL